MSRSIFAWEPVSPKFLLALPPLDRALLLRHLCLSVAAFVAYCLRTDLHLGPWFLRIAGLTVLLNLGSSLLARMPHWVLFARNASSLVGISTWCALAGTTGGVSSPFASGLALEIILSGLTYNPRGTLLVTAACAVGLWIQQAFLGLTGVISILLLEGLLLVAIGLMVAFVVGRWAVRQEELLLRAASLADKLSGLEAELEASRPLIRIGEGSARIAHSVKNAISTLRGYCQLLEQELSQEHSGHEALRGLIGTTHRLETLAMTTLLPQRDTARAADGHAVRLAVDEVLEAVRHRHPTIRWVREDLSEFPPVSLSPELLREVLFLLAQNAAEALHGSGEVGLASRQEGTSLRIDVSDHGPGVPASLMGRLFRPGASAKAGGSGYGLFLAKRLIEEHGGSLLVTGGSGETVFSIRLPVSTT
ncbi:MAG: ATP-binding protein [Acidobacteria bacterium]|nr:ATP-binding protein [Acidobacteriota bacterium]